MTTPLRTLLTLAALLSASGCSISGFGPEFTDLAEARTRWEANGPEDYVYAVERLCFCAGRGPARVTVRNGVVVDVVLVEPDGWGEPSPERFPGVDGLFAILEEAMARDAHAIEVTYDPDTGVPLEFFIDYEENVADEELGMRVTEPVTALLQG